MQESSDHGNNIGATIEPHRRPYLSAKADVFGAADPNSISSFEPLDAKAAAKKIAKLHP
jgi:hypothetical protein